MNNFAKKNSEGNQLEDLVESLLEDKGAHFVRNHFDPQDPGEQHKGDFRLLKHDIYLECKFDKLFDKYNNAYFELAEVRDENAPKDAKTVQAIGIAKHSMKAPTVMIHQLGKEKRFLVYGARYLTDLALMGKKVTGLAWNEMKDYSASREDKTNCALLWKGIDRRSNPFMQRNTIQTNTDGLLIAISQVAKRELTAPAQNERVMLDLMETHGGGIDWTYRGWDDYEYQVPGEGSFGPVKRRLSEEEEEAAWFEAAKFLSL